MNQTQLVLIITTCCDRRCPYCSHGTRWRERWYADIFYLEQMAAQLRGRFRELMISGGEPTLHPFFEDIVRKSRKWFDVSFLEVQTNGRDLARAASIQDDVDRVSISFYRQDGVVCPTPDEIARVSQLFRPGKAAVWSSFGHIPLDVPPRAVSRRCGRVQTASLLDGRLYPCCTAAGFPETASIPVAPGWETQLEQLAYPCERCAFSEPQAGAEAERDLLQP